MFFTVSLAYFQLAWLIIGTQLDDLSAFQEYMKDLGSRHRAWPGLTPDTEHDLQQNEVGV